MGELKKYSHRVRKAHRGIILRILCELRVLCERNNERTCNV